MDKPYEVEDDHLSLDEALAVLADATDMAVYAGPGSANVAWTCRMAIKRIAELESALSLARC